MFTVSLESLRHYRNVTVMGIGRFGGGGGAARFFAGLGANVTATDLAPAEKLADALAALDGLGIHFVLGEHRQEDFAKADLIVANQAVRPENDLLQLARIRGVPIVTETGLALALNAAPWVGVTGSSGKSTTTCLLASMLAEADGRTLLGGNIGGDLLTRVSSHPADAPVVVELSSFQLSYIKEDFDAGRVRPPRIAVITNLAPNHLDWHVDMSEYLAAKRALLLAQTQEDWAILNMDDYRLAAWAVTAPGRVVHCALEDTGHDDACFVRDGGIVLRLGGEQVAVWPLAIVRLPGKHNLYNAVTAAAGAYVFSNNAEAVGRGLAGFTGLPHRLEHVIDAGGRAFINDSKATTPEASVIALDAFDRPVVLIAGGYDKYAPFDSLAEAVQRRAAGLVLVGAAAGRLQQAVQGAAGRRPEGKGELPVVLAGDDFRKAVVEAWRLTPEGGVVLLSPGCASYGMFVNYEERGGEFGRIARELAEAGAHHAV